MLDWLIDYTNLLGLPLQNWLLLVGCALVVYIGALALPHRRRHNTH